MTALFLGVLVGVVALALDGGMLLDQRRCVQAAADAGALAAAADLYAHAQAGSGLDTDGSAAASARSVAAANGFTDDGVTSVLTVNIPPAAGNFAGVPGYAEVIVQYNQPRAFSALFGDGDIPVRACAVARGRWTTFPTGILVLDPAGQGALTLSGSGSVSVNGAGVVVDSDSAQAVGGGGTLAAPQFDLAGTTSGGGALNGPIQYAAEPTPDPLGYLPAPDPTALPLRSNSQLQITGNDPVTLSPGRYRGGILASGAGALTLLPGTYYLDGGGFNVTGQGSFTAKGVLLYNVPAADSDAVSLNRQGGVSFTPPTTGIYQGMSVFQARSSNVALAVTGGRNTTITGTFYAAHATLNITGTGGSSVVGSQYVCYRLVLGGDAAVLVDWSAGPTARTRLIGLVE